MVNYEYIISVMNAFYVGKKIERKAKNNTDDWELCENPAWNWEDFVYRVVIEKIPMWQYIIKNESGYYVTAKFYKNETEAYKDMASSFYEIVGVAEWTKIMVEKE